MQISIGWSAPNFVTTDIFENEIALENYRGKKVLVAFFRNAACAICNLRIHQMIQRYPEWHKQGLEVIAVFESPVESMRQYVGKQDVPFTLIGDPTGRLYSLYGVEVSESKVEKTMTLAQTPQVIAEAAEAGFALTREAGSNFHRIPAEFLLDENLTVQKAYYGEFVYDHLPFEEIDQFVAAGEKVEA